MPHVASTSDYVMEKDGEPIAKMQCRISQQFFAESLQPKDGKEQTKEAAQDLSKQATRPKQRDRTEQLLSKQDLQKRRPKSEGRMTLIPHKSTDKPTQPKPPLDITTLRSHFEMPTSLTVFRGPKNQRKKNDNVNQMDFKEPYVSQTMAY